MHRTEGSNFGTDDAGNNVFKETPLPPSTIGADWLNAVQEEICNAITASGQEIKTAATDTAHNQLALAIAASQDVYDVSVSSQAAFNDLWQRTGANAYKIKDGIRSVLLKYLNGGYYLTGPTSPLSGGDTYGVFSTNQMTRLDCTGGTQIEFGNDNGKLVINTEEASYSNLKLHRGTGSQELLTISATRTNSLTVRKMYALNNYSIISIGGKASAINALSLGDASSASGEYANAVGSTANASGQESFAGGPNTMASGGGSLALGNGAEASNDDASAIGAAATTSEANVMKLGNSATTVKTQSAIVVISDERDKSEIADNDAGLSVINKIKTRKFKMNPREAYFIRDEKGKLVKDKDCKLQYDEAAYKAKIKAGKRWHRGVIAQEIAEEFDSNDFAIIKDSKVNSPESFDQLGVDYQEFIAILIKSVQELSAKVNALEAKIAEVKNG